MNYATLKDNLDNYIKTNGDQDITGQVLQEQLFAMINSLGAGYQYMGVATTSTNPGTPDQRVFYIATTVGSYPNFGSGGLSVAAGEVAIFYFDSSWHKAVTGAATSAQVAELGQKVGGLTLNSLVDGGDLVFEQGTIVASTGANTSDSTVIRSAGVLPTSVGRLSVPSGFVIFRIIYYSSWTDASTFTYSAYESAGGQSAVLNSSYNYARILVRNSGGTAITPSDLISALPLLSPEVEQRIGQIELEVGKMQTLPALLDSYDYNLTDGSYVGSFEIKAGQFIKSTKFISTANSGAASSGIFVIRKSDLVCVYHQLIKFTTGTNDIPVGFTADADCYFGVYGLKLKYSSGGSVPTDSVYSMGLKYASPTFPEVGEVVTLSDHYSGKYALSICIDIVGGLAGKVETNSNAIDAPGINGPEMLNSFDYQLGSTLSCVCDQIVPPGATIISTEFAAQGDSGQTPGVFYVIRKSDLKCVFKKEFPFSAGSNVIPINYKADAACYWGVYRMQLSYSNSANIPSESVFSNKLKIVTPASPEVGDSVTITPTYSNYYALSVSINYGVGLNLEVDAIEEEAPEFRARISAVESAIERGTIYPHGAIISFIDDDSGKYVPDIWGDILSQSPIRMGFACVTGFMSGQETPPEIYEQMSLAYLQGLYADGHEVYSHSYDHPSFYEVATSVEDVMEQCYKSKDWLLTNGFFRGSDIIVYPGGLGMNETQKQAAVRQFFAYGVDTVGNTYNPEPIKPWTIYRINADTGTLASLKSAVDSAVAAGALLVFMNHAYQLNLDKNTQVAKMVDLIDYIKGTTAEILPLGEALHKIYGW